MADIQNFTITPLGPGAVQTIRATITAEVRDSSTQELIGNFTGANAIAFPAALRDLTPAQQQAMLELVAYYVVLAKAGLWPETF